MPLTTRLPALVLAAVAALAGCKRGRDPAPSSGQPSAPPPGQADTTARDSLQAKVQARLDSLPAQSSFYARDIRTGRTVAVRADQPMNTVSVIKLAVMVQAYRDADAGRLKLDERHLIRPEEMRQGSGVLRMFAPGLQPTYRDLITQMIATSDNTASDILIARVGRDRVNHLLDSLQYRETRLRMTLGELFRGVWVQLDSANVRMTDRQVFDRGFPDDSAAPERFFRYVTDSTHWLGRTTAREIGLFLEQLELGRLASETATDEMRGALLNQVWDTRLPQRIGERVPVGHKTGDWEPQIGNDVGIVFAPSGPIVMAAFTNANTGPMWQLNAALGRVAEDVLNAWTAAR
ncbi:MAG TPA: serine hydrolase [Gemmatimonadales bacterium]|nr:serine hydrolase [Gemmatimonadales bacterium]